MIKGHTILNKLTFKWRLLVIAEAILWVTGLTWLVMACLSALGVVNAVWLVVLMVLLFLIVALFILQPWKIDQEATASYIDSQITAVENSTYLLTQQDGSLSLLAQIQRKRVQALLNTHQQEIKVPHHLLRGIIGLLALLSVSFVIQNIDFSRASIQIETPNPFINFTAVDSLSAPVNVRIANQRVVIKPPQYTGAENISSDKMNVKALEGSVLSWTLKFTAPLKEVNLESIGKYKRSMKPYKGAYQLTSTLAHSGFYKFNYTDVNDRKYESDIFQLVALKDQSPTVAINNLDRFTLLEFNDNKNISFKTSLADDYGLASTSIIATVSKGTGESVKFREERMDFDKPLKNGAKKATLTKSINLDALKMTPGDELYFYVEVYDNKQPTPNRNRTETYFISIRDTTNYEFSLEGALGVDLMPEYFRSQRQIIIETEQLIKDKPKLAEKDFNFKSNELGFDQKTLRLKYGQFMGEEFETGITAEPEHEEIDHAVDHEDEDPLAEYSHNHDGDNEHNLVAETGEEEEDPLHDYKHNHDDPEETTLYTASVKGKLRAAMTEMWDAELYLRLYEPEKSLPYQYRALELIKEIKNHARIYVHRMGFDPPPIKEDKRLTGKIEDVKTTTKQTQNENEVPYPSIRYALTYIEKLLAENWTAYDGTVFKKAGDELAGIAIEAPGKYLQTLQILQKLSIKQVPAAQLPGVLNQLQGELNEALPKPLPSPYIMPIEHDGLTKSFLEALKNSSND